MHNRAGAPQAKPNRRVVKGVWGGAVGGAVGGGRGQDTTFVKLSLLTT